MLIVAFISGAISGYFEAGDLQEPLWSELISTALLLFLLLSWYHIDSNEHQYQRNVWMTVAIIGFALVAVPYYLVRSRVPGKKLSAVTNLLLFALLFTAVSAAGEYAVILLN